MDDRSPTLLYSGAFGAGKTVGLCERAIRTMLVHPGTFVGFFRKTQRSIKQTTMRTFFRLLPREYLAEFNRTELHGRLFNSSEFTFLGLDDPDKIGSLELDEADVDEATETTLDDWVMLEGRVGRGPAGLPGQLCGATNPSGPGHHLYQRFFVRGEGRVIRTETRDNRFLPAAYTARLDTFRGVFRERYVRGQWVGMEGLVYDCFNPAVHVIDPFPIPPEWPRFRGIDFGHTNPFVCLWVALSPDGDRHVYRELYFSHRLVSEHARDILRLSEGETIEASWADHDAEGRAVLEEQGVPTDRADKAVQDGIQEVYRLLAPAEGTGRPRLFFHRDALVERDPRLEAAGLPSSTVEEIQSYAWHRAGDGKPSKDQPVKLNDHGCDCTRYLCMGLRTWSAGAPFAFA